MADREMPMGVVDRSSIAVRNQEVDEPMRAIRRKTSTGSEAADAAPTSTEGRPMARRFTYRYALALVVFSVLAVWTLWTMTQSLERIDRANRELAATTEQQSRVNQIAALGWELVTRSNNDSPASTAELALYRGQVQELISVQRALLEGSDEMHLPGDPSPDVEALYFGPGTRLANEITSFTDQAERLPGLLEPEADPAPREELIGQMRASADPVNGNAGSGLEQAVALYSQKIDNAVDDQRRADQGLLLLFGLAVGVMVFAVFRPMANSIQLETTNLREAERDHRENNERQTFHNQLNQALEGTESEDEILQAVARAMSEIIPDEKGELLLVDQSGAHLRQAQVNDVGGPNCPVDSPQACAALRRGQTVAYETSRALNVCPKLTQHEGDACSAVCSPVMFLGRSIGVLHATGTDMVPPNSTEVERLNVLARETGNRLGTMRASALTQHQASTDGLTGLPNRRSLERAANDLVTVGRPFTIAMADLDHFKQLNDSEGHEAGDRALRLFARTIRQNLRPDDVAARYGGEEFVLLLPNTSIEEARRALDRLRVTLAGDIAAAGTARFTASWGLATSESRSTFDEMLVAADEALYAAKRAGRNRVEINTGRAATSEGDGVDHLDHGQAAPSVDGQGPEADNGQDAAGQCRECGNVSPYDSRFCLECGHELSPMLDPAAD
jgi:diguanylate cyclase (GGDEF)-like protein